MARKFIILTLLLFLVVVSISGCTTKEASNGTFGEKTISLSNITIVNNVTAEHYEYEGLNYYYIYGFLKNNNRYDAFNLKMKATAFDADNNIVAVNDTFYLNPKVVPAGGESEFYFEFEDPDMKIVRYELQLIYVDSEDK